MTVLAALGWALARGGGLEPRIPHLTWTPVLAAGLVGQLVLATADLDPGAAAALGVLSHAALLAVGIVNFRLPGMAALTAGVLANALVMLGNGGMPVSPRAVAALGGDPSTLPAAGHHHALTATTRLPWLADVLGLDWLGLVVSPGDALLVVGAVTLLGAALAGEID